MQKKKTKKVDQETHNDQETQKLTARATTNPQVLSIIHRFIFNLNPLLAGNIVAPVGPNSFLFQLPCFSEYGGILPKLLSESIHWEPFNDGMHKKFGYKGVSPFPKIPVTDEIFSDLENYHNYIEPSCQWMLNVWITNLKEFSPKFDRDGNVHAEE